MNDKLIETYRLDKVVEKTASATLGVLEQVVGVDATAGARTITLPPVAEAAGRFYSIRKIDAVANAVTVKGGGDEMVAYSNANLDAQNDRVIVWSDGQQWHEIESTIADAATVAIVNVATALKVDQTVATVANTAAVTVTLPAVAAAKGKIYTITKISADAYAITIKDALDATLINTLDANNDRAAYYSDGVRWWLVASTIA